MLPFPWKNPLDEIPAGPRPQQRGCCRHSRLGCTSVLDLPTFNSTGWCWHCLAPVGHWGRDSMWEIQRSAPWSAVLSTMAGGERDMYHLSFHVYYPGLGDNVWMWIPQVYSLSNSQSAFELMPGVSSQWGLRLLLLPSPHSSYSSVAGHKFGWSEGRDAVSSSRQRCCPVPFAECPAHLWCQRSNK